MTREERARLEYAYNRLYDAYERTGELRPAEIDEMYRIYDVIAEPSAGAAPATIEARPVSVAEDVGDWFADKARRVSGDTPWPLSDRESQSIGRRVSGAIEMIPGMSSAITGPQAVRDFRNEDYAGAAGNAGMTALDLLTLGLGSLGVSTLNRAGRAVTGPGGVGDAAAATYKIGDRLSPASSYRGVPGKPSQFALPGGLLYDAKPINEIEQAAIDYMQRRGMDTSSMQSYPAFSEERARLIAAAYDMMRDDPQNPAVRRAYDAMVSETLDQYNALKGSGIDFKFLTPGMADPYEASPAMGYKDLVENGRLWVFPTEAGYGDAVGADYFDPAKNPLLTRVGLVGDKPDAVANDAFRAVHDAFGHYGPGNPLFRRKGEERAFLEHSRMYSPEARGAMTSETRGQNSWLNSGPHGARNRVANTGDTIFADQKIGLMPDWTSNPTGLPDEQEMRYLLDYIERSWPQ